MDHVFALLHLIEKYTLKMQTALYVMFCNLRAAFDSISQTFLWLKLGTIIDILFFKQRAVLKVRYTAQEMFYSITPIGKGCVFYFGICFIQFY